MACTPVFNVSTSSHGNRVVIIERAGKTRAQKHQSMTWAQRLKRVFNIDIETCEQCGGAVKVIASIEDPLVIQKILSHLNTKQLC